MYVRVALHNSALEPCDELQATARLPNGTRSSAKVSIPLRAVEEPKRAARELADLSQHGAPV